MEKFFVQNDDIRLEAEYYNSSSDGDMAVLICHPHPQLGGNFNNNVVSAVFNELISSDISCMRFNFRGVGRSNGRHSNDEGELSDVNACLKYLIKKRNLKRLIVCGYSYGAAIGCSAASSCENVIGYVAISFPWDFMGEKFKILSQTTKPKHFVQGDRDQIASYSKFENHYLSYSNPKSKAIIKGADHLYVNHEEEVSYEVLNFCRGMDKK